MTARIWTVVLDDDPTGTQGLNDVPVVIRCTPAAFAWAFDHDGDILYVLTNTRALSPQATIDIVVTATDLAVAEAARRGGSVRFVSRGDSTLRGHFPLEIATLRHRNTQPSRGCLLVPAFPAAGRITLNGVHLVDVDGELTPVADSEYARDATFGYTSSVLTEWTADRIPSDWGVTSIDSKIFDAGVQVVADTLAAVESFTVVCPSIRDETDLETLAAAQRLVEKEGISFLVQAGPSYPPLLAALPPAKPARPSVASAYGLVVVGSHTRTTSTQLAHLADGRDIAIVEVQVKALLAEGGARGEVKRVARAASEQLAHRTVVIATSRERVDGDSRADSLDIAGTIAAALTRIERQILQSRPSYIIAKGGITSRDVVADALQWDAAMVVGPLVDATLPVWRSWRSTTTDPVAVIFPGNVGQPDLLSRAVDQLDILKQPTLERTVAS